MNTTFPANTSFSDTGEPVKGYLHQIHLEHSVLHQVKIGFLTLELLSSSSIICIYSCLRKNMHTQSENEYDHETFFRVSQRIGYHETLWEIMLLLT